MRARRRTRAVRGVALVAAVACTSIVSGCGGDDFENKPRPPVAVELTGVIQPDHVTVSPKRIGAGPVLITISNQTPDAHTITLEGETVKERVGPVNPEDTATIQKTLAPGRYEVRAGSSVAVPKEITPAELVVGRARKNSNDKLLLP
jgi:hypothetical protein